MHHKRMSITAISEKINISTLCYLITTLGLARCQKAHSVCEKNILWKGEGGKGHHPIIKRLFLDALASHAFKLSVSQSVADTFSSLQSIQLYSLFHVSTISNPMSQHAHSLHSLMSLHGLCNLHSLNSFSSVNSLNSLFSLFSPYQA